ncbi:uncharacterized protein LOC119953482 [Scyliorhinus canicula]|uniref:uncharacterized protein LOC119953482 n=1 Tax=Scyliorhinus canicula TaxID=7830 RepID=UPI0018F5990C|nr:uncharacterized protein LOC119953482 [Scyliorhinus canicula]
MGNQISKQSTPSNNQIPTVASSSFTSFWKHRKYPTDARCSVDDPRPISPLLRNVPITNSQTKGKSSSLKDVAIRIVKSRARIAEDILKKWFPQGISVLDEGRSVVTVPTAVHQTSSGTSADVVTDVKISSTGTSTWSNLGTAEASSTPEVPGVKTPSNPSPVKPIDRRGLNKNIRFMHLQSYMLPNNNRPEFHFYTSSLDGPPNYYFWYSPYWQIQNIPLSAPISTKQPPESPNPASEWEPAHLETPALQHVQLCSYLARTQYDKALYDIFFHIPDPYISKKELLSVPDEDAEFWGTLHFTGINAAQELLSKRRFEKICAEILIETKTRGS